MGAPTELEVIEDGDHSFHVSKSYAIDPTEIDEQILCRIIERVSALDAKLIFQLPLQNTDFIGRGSHI